MNSEMLKSTENRRAFPGLIFNVVPGAANDNVFIAEVEGLAGSEPPRHVHTREDEIVVIKEGTITYFIGDETISAVAGDTVVLPKDIPHHFVITSKKMKITLITTSEVLGIFSASYRSLIVVIIFLLPSVQLKHAKRD